MLTVLLPGCLPVRRFLLMLPVSVSNVHCPGQEASPAFPRCCVFLLCLPLADEHCFDTVFQHVIVVHNSCCGRRPVGDGRGRAGDPTARRARRGGETLPFDMVFQSQTTPLAQVIALAPPFCRPCTALSPLFHCPCTALSPPLHQPLTAIASPLHCPFTAISPTFLCQSTVLSLPCTGFQAEALSLPGLVAAVERAGALRTAAQVSARNQRDGTRVD